MKASWWRTPYGVDRWRTQRATARLVAVGLILGLITIFLSALNAVSAQLAFALAVSATILTIGGLLWSRTSRS